MRSETLRVELSTASFEAVAARLREMSRLVAEGCDRLAESLCELGAEAARAAAPGSLAAEIQVVAPVEGVGQVRIDDEKACFAEFGTGITRGGAQPYPADIPVHWVYGEGTPEHQAAHDGDGWWYYDDRGRRRFTLGQYPKAFMLAGAETMRQAAVGRAREVLR